jgi:tetratricopeptide (TPR) repeat protein
VAQRALPPGFRAELAAETGPPYASTDPRELPDRLRTDRWRRLCDALDGWRELPGEGQCRLASLLHSMCLYQPLLALIPPGGVRARDAPPHAIELAFWRASAEFMLGLPRRISEYRHADMSVFEEIALDAPGAVPAGFNATAMVFVHKAKTGAPVRELAEWHRRFEKALALARDGVDEFTAGLFTSRFYRGAGFLPQRGGDRREVARIMDLAERHALGLTPATPAQWLLYRENLHALLESRTKEALWLEDKDLALARSSRVVEVDPYDAKAWAEVGEVRFLREEWPEAARAYATAAMAVGRHMAGVCLREMGQETLAALLFRDTLEIDPLGISPREEIHELPDVAALTLLREWSRSTTSA